MKYVIAAVIGLILIGNVGLAFDDEGVQWWTSTEVSTGLTKNWKVTFEQALRLGNDGGNLYYEHSDLLLTYSGLAEWLDVGAAFRVIYEKDSKDVWTRENRPHFDVTLKGKLFDCSVSSRSRFEFRDLKDKEDVWRYRNKFTLKLPFELTELKLKPYIADEIFITLTDDEIDRNRAYLGVIWPLCKGLDADIYYMWQTSKSIEEWKDIYVIGTGLKFRF
jgi:hypothetical protein